LIDLCRGPHVAHTGKVKAFAATRHSATNWLGDTDNDSLQRMYGISFPDKKQLKAWQENMEKVRTLHGFCFVAKKWTRMKTYTNLILGLKYDRQITIADSSEPPMREYLVAFGLWIESLTHLCFALLCCRPRNVIIEESLQNKSLSCSTTCPLVALSFSLMEHAFTIS
jgi:hypothetical protein